MFRSILTTAVVFTAGAAMAQSIDVSVENGSRVAVIGGCHDCHSQGYAETGGTLDPATALKGNLVGYQGPWGTTYAKNLRLTAAKMSEDDWVTYMATIETAPPMPWFNLHHFTEAEARSLHQYILSLGEPGDPAPTTVPPGEAPKTPYIVFAPPVMPKG